MKLTVYFWALGRVYFHSNLKYDSASMGCLVLKGSEV